MIGRERDREKETNGKRRVNGGGLMGGKRVLPEIDQGIVNI